MGRVGREGEGRRKEREREYRGYRGRDRGRGRNGRGICCLTRDIAHLVLYPATVIIQ